MGTAGRRHLFISYARVDELDVNSFLGLVRTQLDQRRIPVDIWQDQDVISPGASWKDEIQRALEESIGLLVFVSQASMQSDYVRQELSAILSGEDRLIVPVILQHVTDMPLDLMERQWVDISDDLGDTSRLTEKAARLAEGLSRALPRYKDKSLLSSNEAETLAEITASSARKSVAPPLADQDDTAPTSVFVVHGHDTPTLELVGETLREIGIEPVVLSQQLGQSQSLLQKFLGVSQKARFAVVLLTSDDYGASLRQFDEPGVAERSLQFRARQNVILELGFFYGHLGWENVFVLQRKTPKVFPNFERPSDLGGAVFDEIDDAGLWKKALQDKLKGAGFLIHSD